MKKITTFGIDLAKNVFQVHGVDCTGKVIRRQLKRSEVFSFFSKYPGSLIGMEACGGSHYWALNLSRQGHTVKPIPPQYVKMRVLRNKTDGKDAEAIYLTVQDGRIQGVGIKSESQLDLSSLHRARESSVRERTALCNQIRGLLLEYGIAIPQGIRRLRARLEDLLEGREECLSDLGHQIFGALYKRLNRLDEDIADFELLLKESHREDEAHRKLQQIPGVGFLTASAILASVADANSFRRGKEFASWIGLTPRESSSGGKQRLMGICKRGNVYLRTLLIHGARSVIQFAELKQPKGSWLRCKLESKPKNVAAVALANKNARIIWAVLAHKREFQRDYISLPPESGVNRGGGESLFHGNSPSFTAGWEVLSPPL